MLRLELATGSGGDLDAGSLVEVGFEQTIYLGQVYSRDADNVVVGVEHAIDRDSLASIRETWSPGRD